MVLCQGNILFNLDYFWGVIWERGDIGEGTPFEEMFPWGLWERREIECGDYFWMGEYFFSETFSKTSKRC